MCVCACVGVVIHRFDWCRFQYAVVLLRHLHSKERLNTSRILWQQFCYHFDAMSGYSAASVHRSAHVDTGTPQRIGTARFLPARQTLKVHGTDLLCDVSMAGVLQGVVR